MKCNFIISIKVLNEAIESILAKNPNYGWWRKEKKNKKKNFPILDKMIKDKLK